MPTPTGTVTDMVAFCKAYDELEKVVKEVPTPHRQRLDRLIDEMLALVTLDVDIPTMTRNLLKGMPDKREELEECFRQFGWQDELGGY